MRYWRPKHRDAQPDPFTLFYGSPNYEYPVPGEPSFLYYPSGGTLLITDYYGPSSSFVADYSLSVGYHSAAWGRNNFAFGHQSSIDQGGYGSTSLDYLPRDNVIFGRFSHIYFTGNNGYGDDTTPPVGNFIFGNYNTISDGDGNFIVGDSISVMGDQGFAFGDYSSVGNFAIALGMSADAVGDSSVSIGGGSMAVGDSSVSIGNGALVTSRNGIALGLYNASVRKDGSSPDPTLASDADPILMLGNGFWVRGSYVRSNALTVYRDGDTHFTRVVRVPPAGDISMGAFTSKPTDVQYAPDPVQYQ